MKRFLTILSLCLLFCGIQACGANPGKKISQNRISTLVNGLQADAARAGSEDEEANISLPGLKVTSQGGLDMVTIGNFWIKTGAKFLSFADDDQDMKEAARLMKSLNKLMIVSYDGCEERLRSDFDRKIGKTLDGCDLLMEAKDGGESMSIYGNSSRDGKLLEDIVFYSPENSTLICFFGTLDTDKFGEFVKKAMND